MPLGVFWLSVHLARCPLGVVPVKFPSEVDAAVEVISSFDAYGPRVLELAARHVGSGIADPAHHALAEALLGALGAHRTAVWDDAFDSAWRRAYNLVADMMMAAAADVSAHAMGGRRSSPRRPAPLTTLGPP